MTIDKLVIFSETTENEYLTPAEQAAANKGSRHRRSHSDSSSSRTIMSPWSKDNRILTPKVCFLNSLLLSDGLQAVDMIPTLCLISRCDDRLCFFHITNIVSRDLIRNFN